MGCKLVIDPHASKPKPNFEDVALSQSASTLNQYGTPENGFKPTYLPEKPSEITPKPDDYPSEALNKPLEIPQKPTIQYGLNIPNIETVRPGSYGNQNLANSYTKPETYNRPNSHGAQVIKGSLVSVSPGIQSYLHPVHDILIGENPYTYGKPKPDRPLGYLPERPYGVHNSNDGDKNYENFPSNIYKRPNGYDGYHGERPWGHEFIDNPKFLSPFDPYYDERPNQRPTLNTYADQHPIRPSNFIDERPMAYPGEPHQLTNSYNNEKPSDMYGRPPTNQYEDERPSYSYNKPQRPLNSYDFQYTHESVRPSTEKPYKPVHEKPENEGPFRPHEDHLPPFRPHHLNNPYDDERPLLPNRPRPGGYDSRPTILDDRIDTNHYTRPHLRPEIPEPNRFEYEIPRPMGNIHDDRDRPRPFDKPYTNHLRPDYDAMNSHHSGHDYTRPDDDYRSPQRPYNDHRRPSRPEDDYRKPLKPEDDDRRHSRPTNDYRRPSGPDEDFRRPIRPEDDRRRPFRPDDNYRMPVDPIRRPERDFRRPMRPGSDSYRKPDDNYKPQSWFDDERSHRRPTNTDDKGYSRPDFHDRRPYDQRQPEDPNLIFRKPDYLFSANDRHDVVSNSTNYVNSNSEYSQKTNGTKYANGTNENVTEKGHEKGDSDKNSTLSNAMITESTGVDGEKITSIIIPLENGKCSIFTKL